MKVHKVEILVVDHDELGSTEIENVFEDSSYPNDCIHPSVMSVETIDIGEWHDGHPLNFKSKEKEEYYKLFPCYVEKPIGLGEPGDPDEDRAKWLEKVSKALSCGE